ncbi:Uncharacterised protein [Oligella urethralis]|uniref:hypothetical protein n=1 Tax=Oligella urethralis TaxID=90245 RepID=UPI000E066BDB|nr:hypothetical protein [Oligella urethralis]SUA63219.1 Uncharacterised protein [Oligella urethralis]
MLNNSVINSQVINGSSKTSIIRAEAILNSVAKAFNKVSITRSAKANPKDSTGLSTAVVHVQKHSTITSGLVLKRKATIPLVDTTRVRTGIVEQFNGYSKITHSPLSRRTYGESQLFGISIKVVDIAGFIYAESYISGSADASANPYQIVNVVSNLVGKSKVSSKRSSKKFLNTSVFGTSKNSTVAQRLKKPNTYISGIAKSDLNVWKFHKKYFMESHINGSSTTNGKVFAIRDSKSFLRSRANTYVVSNKRIHFNTLAYGFSSADASTYKIQYFNGVLYGLGNLNSPPLITYRDTKISIKGVSNITTDNVLKITPSGDFIISGNSKTSCEHYLLNIHKYVKCPVISYGYLTGNGLLNVHIKGLEKYTMYSYARSPDKRMMVSSRGSQSMSK